MAATNGLENSPVLTIIDDLYEIGWKSPTFSALKDWMSAPAIKSFFDEIKTAALIQSSLII